MEIKLLILCALMGTIMAFAREPADRARVRQQMAHGDIK